MEKNKCAICGVELTLKEEVAHVILNGTYEWEICQDCADDAFWEFMNRKTFNA